MTETSGQYRIEPQLEPTPEENLDPATLTKYLIIWYCTGTDDYRLELEEKFRDQSEHGEEVIFYLRKNYERYQQHQQIKPDSTPELEEDDEDDEDVIIPKLKALDSFADSCDRRLLTMIKVLEFCCQSHLIEYADKSQEQELRELVKLLTNASDYAREMKYGYLPKFNWED